jgi:hypothetical protein
MIDTNTEKHPAILQMTGACIRHIILLEMLWEKFQTL